MYIFFSQFIISQATHFCCDFMRVSLSLTLVLVCALTSLFLGVFFNSDPAAAPSALVLDLDFVVFFVAPLLPVNDADERFNLMQAEDLDRPLLDDVVSLTIGLPRFLVVVID